MIKKLMLIIALVVVLGLGALAFFVSTHWNTPLGPALELSTQVNELVGSSLSNPAGDSSEQGETPQPTPNSLLERIISLLKPKKSGGTTLCEGPSSMTILLIGSDERSNDYMYGLADSIRVVRVDFTNPGVMMVDIPRDLWVEIPGISDHYGITHGKLNQAYFFGNPGMGYYDGPGNGSGLLARTLDQNFGLQVDHYLAVDLTTFENFIDSVGGIDVSFDTNLDLNMDPTIADPDLIFNAGKNHLTGAQALKLASNRYPTTFQRARNQDIVLKAMRDKLLSPAILPKLPSLVAKFSKSVQTDLSMNELNMFLCLAQSVNEENIKSLQFPESMFTSQRTYDPYRNINTFTLGADFSQIRTYFEEFKNGTWPSP